ncbi:MAG: hypothetical protein IPL59_08480 [Candidatus Competibacteraceae bacterium]|nr:hypothetical protein [Candidatus Competibacteraceae bacterium]
MTAEDRFKARWLWQSYQVTSTDPNRKPAAYRRISEGLDAGCVVLLAYPVAAGDIIGFTQGKYIHIEIFSNIDFTSNDYTDKKFIDDLDTDNLFATKEILQKLKMIEEDLSQEYDGPVLKEEIIDFFKGGDELAKMLLRGSVTRHISEWSTEVEWPKINKAEAGAAWGYYDDAAVDKLQAITKLYAWMDPTVSKHCKLADHHILVHYHPIQFIWWLARKVRIGKAQQLIQDTTPFLGNAGKPVYVGDSAD